MRIPVGRQTREAGWLASASDSPVRIVSIPLKGSRTFDFRYPTDLTKEDFAHVMENMKLCERQIVASEE